MSEVDVSSGAKLGLKIRDGQCAKVGSTKRIQELNGMLHANRPNIDIHRTKVFTKVFKETEGEPEIRRRYKAFAETYRTLKPVIYDHERLAGWPASKIRGVQIAIEMHAHWLAEDLDQMETREYDPFEITPEDKKELCDLHIPYWKNKTLTKDWEKCVSAEESNRGQAGGVSDVTNYITSHGSHFIPDYPFLMENGFVKYYNIAKEKLDGLNPNDPESIDKREFYKGIIEVSLAVKEFGENHANAAAEKAEQEKDPVRKQELLNMEIVMRQVPWLAPRNFYEATEMVWLTLLLLFVEGAGPSITYSRFDQYMYPFYKKGIEDGTLTPELAMEYIEELYIKTTSNPWFQSTALAYIFGGYYRYPHLDVGGLTKDRRDASNELSYLCLRAMRYVKTTAPSVSILLHQKTPDSLLYEACQLAAEGMGHPSFFNIDTMNVMLEHRASGLNGSSPYTMDQILALGSPIGCVEPGVMGHQFGHTDSCIINIAQAASLAITNGVKANGVAGYGCGEVITFESGNSAKFKTFEDYYAAVKAQVVFAIKEAHGNAIIAEKILSEKHYLPTFTMLSSGSVEKGKDVVQGGAYCNVGPTMNCVGLGTLIDSVAAIKKVVYDDKEATMVEMKAALEADFKGYEELQAKLKRAPKYANDDNYVDDIAVELWKLFAETTRSLKTYLGHYCDPAIQMVQANVGFGCMTGSTPNGRLSGTPLSDTMSASQQADTNGPTAAARSYGKLDYPAYTNGTLLNMWVSRSELIKK